ncbi:MAG: hypothetical protein A2Z30_08485 [Chloroflexi bacterium RBG_16_64_43]|nr:MAG: hypothetical protein A2Z30_08485 [Chloroflexi bacterium RBG_16_64_43]
MEMPVPSPAHRALEALEGSWIGQEKIHPSPFVPAGAVAIGRVVNRTALDGFAVVQDYEQETNGKVNFRGHGVFRYDLERATYVLHWFDSFGLPPSEYKGTFDERMLRLTAITPQGHARATLDFSHKGHYHYTLEVSPDGEEWFASIEGQYNRQG